MKECVFWVNNKSDVQYLVWVLWPIYYDSVFMLTLVQLSPKIFMGKFSLDSFFLCKCCLQCWHSGTVKNCLLPLSHICHLSSVSYLNAFPMAHLQYLLLIEITLYGHLFLIWTVSHKTSNARHWLHEIVCLYEFVNSSPCPYVVCAFLIKLW